MSHGIPDKNKQDITSVEIIPDLDIDETLKFKQLINSLCEKGVCSQEFFNYDYDLKINRSFGIYLYRYIDIRKGCDNIGCIGYLTLLQDTVLNQKWFKNRFVVEDNIENLYLIRRLI